MSAKAPPPSCSERMASEQENKCTATFVAPSDLYGPG